MDFNEKKSIIELISKGRLISSVKFHLKSLGEFTGYILDCWAFNQN